MSEPLAARYARALFEAILDRRSRLTPEEALSQLESFEITLAESAKLRDVLATPAVPLARKRAVVSRLAYWMDYSKVMRNFLFVVVRHRRAGLVMEIRRAFEDLLDEQEGVVRADVSSARELSGTQRQAVTEGLNRLTGKRVKPRFSIDPKLMGGVVARIGSTVYDSSVQGRLAELERHLVESDAAAFERGGRGV